jgi:circadian clock protein KaiC
LDTIEVLFSGLSDTSVLRAELRRLFRWIKDKGLSAIVTGERGNGTLTRYGLEEYVADCVILLDHRMHEQIATRRLRILKYRGSEHATNEFPFFIGEDGITVLPITSIGLQYEAMEDRVSSGVPALDEMLGGQGYYRGTSVYISGTAGTGKTSLAASFAKAACERGEKVLYFAFEESPSQLMRNMKSINVDLEPCAEKGEIIFNAIRPTQYGLEMHLAMMIKLIQDNNPSIVIVDPISNLINGGEALEVQSVLTRIVDYLKSRGITSLFTSLTGGEAYSDKDEVGISSLMDTWISVRNIESAGERNRGLYVLKSRGMSHSNKIREFIMTDHGIELIEPYIGPHGLLIGSARERQQKIERVAIGESK